MKALLDNAKIEVKNILSENQGTSTNTAGEFLQFKQDVRQGKLGKTVNGIFYPVQEQPKQMTWISI